VIPGHDFNFGASRTYDRRGSWRPSRPSGRRRCPPGRLVELEPTVGARACPTRVTLGVRVVVLGDSHVRRGRLVELDRRSGSCGARTYSSTSARWMLGPRAGVARLEPRDAEIVGDRDRVLASCVASSVRRVRDQHLRRRLEEGRHRASGQRAGAPSALTVHVRVLRVSAEPSDQPERGPRCDFRPVRADSTPASAPAHAGDFGSFVGIQPTHSPRVARSLSPPASGTTPPASTGLGTSAYLSLRSEHRRCSRPVPAYVLVDGARAGRSGDSGV